MKYPVPFLLLVLITLQTIAQTDSIPVKKDTSTWAFQHKYDRIIHKKCFSPDMSDEEMAGILMYRAGNNMIGSVICEFCAVLTFSVIPTITETGNSTKVVLGVVGSAFLITGLAQLISGYSKISKAGILLQHKRFSIKTTGTNLSLNF